MTAGNSVDVIGGGLAGCEAAYQLARRGVHVRLHEMRPQTPTAVHKTGDLAELVCSNSFRSDRVHNPVGLLKREMEAFDSLIMRAARQASLPAGSALAVDRDAFSGAVSQGLAQVGVDVQRAEQTRIPGGPAIIAAGPLCSDALAKDLYHFLGDRELYFYDAIAPVVEAESLDMNVLFRQSRYDKGGADYLNIPLDKPTYLELHRDLLDGERVDVGEHDKLIFFEGCLPVEVMAQRGVDTLRFGPLKPVGLIDPRSGAQPYAVVQLRQDNFARSHWNIVGFQTQLKWGEQKRILRKLPGLASAEFVRLGMIHRNTYVNSCNHLLPSFQFRKRRDLFLAGQISGVEGYLESAAVGLQCGIHMARLLRDLEVVPFPASTALGALGHYVSHQGHGKIQPTNINFGIMAPLADQPRVKRRERRRLLTVRALKDLVSFAHTLDEPILESVIDASLADQSIGVV